MSKPQTLAGSLGKIISAETLCQSEPDKNIYGKKNKKKGNYYFRKHSPHSLACCLSNKCCLLTGTQFCTHRCWDVSYAILICVCLVSIKRQPQGFEVVSYNLHEKVHDTVFYRKSRQTSLKKNNKRFRTGVQSIHSASVCLYPEPDSPNSQAQFNT